MIELWFILFLEFFKTGLFTIGGGLAAIPFLQEMGEVHGWFTSQMLSTMIALSESTPGPIGINMATYIGYEVAGVCGSLIATLSIVLPSLIIVCITANYFQKFKEAKIVKNIFSGLKPAVVAFVASACVSLFTSTLFCMEKDFSLTTFSTFFNVPGIILLIGLLLLYKFFPKFHPIFFIILAGVIGVVFQF